MYRFIVVIKFEKLLATSYTVILMSHTVSVGVAELCGHMHTGNERGQGLNHGCTVNKV